MRSGKRMSEEQERIIAEGLSRGDSQSDIARNADVSPESVRKRAVQMRKREPKEPPGSDVPPKTPELIAAIDAGIDEDKAPGDIARRVGCAPLVVWRRAKERGLDWYVGKRRWMKIGEDETERTDEDVPAEPPVREDLAPTIERLSSEVRELRHVWAEDEAMVIKLRGDVDELRATLQTPDANAGKRERRVALNVIRICQLAREHAGNDAMRGVIADTNEWAEEVLLNG